MQRRLPRPRLLHMLPTLLIAASIGLWGGGCGGDDGIVVVDGRPATSGGHESCRGGGLLSAHSGKSAPHLVARHPRPEEIVSAQAPRDVDDFTA